jgi:hypothetical protein
MHGEVDVERAQPETSSHPAHVHEVCTLSKDLGVLWVGLGVCIAQYSKICFCTGKLARMLHASDVICWISQPALTRSCPLLENVLLHSGLNTYVDSWQVASSRLWNRFCLDFDVKTSC